MDKILIFTDGGVRNNNKKENIGAWSYTIMKDNIEERYDYGINLNTETDAQEMRACIEALKSLDDYDAFVEVHSDSSYLVNGMKKWIHTWKKNGWIRGKHLPKPIRHLELWKELDELSSRFSRLRFGKVKAHSDNEGNNRADELVNIAMDEYLNGNL